MSEEFNQVRRAGKFELMIVAPDNATRCQLCGKPAVYEFRIADHIQHLCAGCVKDLRTCLSEEEEVFEDEKKIRWQTLRSWRRYFHEKVSTKSYYNEFPTKLIVETIQDLGCEILDEQGNIVHPETNGVKTGSRTYRLGYNGHVVGNSVLVINWYGEEVHGLTGRVELNAYIS